jgi:hypothetical protein
VLLLSKAERDQERLRATGLDAARFKLTPWKIEEIVALLG